MKKGITKTGKKKAVCIAGKTAKNKQHIGIYHKPIHLSSLKIQIGEILLFMVAGNGQPDDWRQFEQFLGKLYGGLLNES